MGQEASVAVPSSNADGTSVGGRATVQSFSEVAVSGDLNVAARDIIHNHAHYYAAADTSRLPAALKLVPNFRKIHIATLGRATPGTGLWIFVWETFILWLDPDGSIKILWGSGMPGAGKTILTSIVISVLEARAKASSKPICVAYVYIRYSDHTRVTVRDILEALVKQIIERHTGCLALANEVYARHAREETQPGEEELVSLLQEFTKQMAATFYMIDALDEAPPRIQLDLLEKLASLDVKLFITSRPMGVIEAHIPNTYRFKIAPRDEDLDLHIKREISRSPELRALFATTDTAWQNEIVSAIKQKAGGMFLHASLQMNALRDCTSVYDVKETLEKFPTPIEDVYIQTWNRILDQPHKKALLAKSALLWVLTATRSLKMEELQRAVATSPDTYRFDANRIVPPSTIMSLCRGLLTVEEGRGLVRLVHYTAKETLDTLIHQTVPHPHSVLAAVCMAHLIDCGFQRNTFKTVEDFKTSLQADSLLAYAYHEWPIHTRQSLHVACLAKQLGEFVAGCHSFLIFEEFSARRHDLLGPLHVTAYFNLPIAFAGSSNLQDPNLPTAIRGTPPLSLACLRNSQTAFEELLHLPEIDVNAVNKDGGLPALISAMRNEQTDLFLRLSKHADIDVNVRDDCGATPLMLAAQSNRRHSGFFVEHLLAHPKVEVNLAENQFGWTALMSATSEGLDDKAELLLAHPRINVNQVNHQGMTALMLAARRHHPSTIELLLACSDIQVNQRDPYGRTALMWASQDGHGATVAALLAHPEVRADLTDERGWTAAKLAAICDHERIVKLFEGQT